MCSPCRTGRPLRQAITRKPTKNLDFFTSFGNSLAITVSAIVLLLIFCSMAAWVLARYKQR